MSNNKRPNIQPKFTDSQIIKADFYVRLHQWNRDPETTRFITQLEAEHYMVIHLNAQPVGYEWEYYPPGGLRRGQEIAGQAMVRISIYGRRKVKSSAAPRMLGPDGRPLLG